MERAGQKTRDIQFFSPKNQAMRCVHTAQARKYAQYLESKSEIVSYETNRILELDETILSVGIRQAYLKTQWTSDFFLQDAAGHRMVREMVKREELTKRAVLEKLELSRRYWSAFDVLDWKLVVWEDVRCNF